MSELVNTYIILRHASRRMLQSGLLLIQVFIVLADADADAHTARQCNAVRYPCSLT